VFGTIEAAIGAADKCAHALTKHQLGGGALPALFIGGSAEAAAAEGAQSSKPYDWCPA